MVVKARVLGWGLHKSMSFIQLPQESHKCKISLQIWNSFNQNEARYDIPIFVLSNYYSLLFKDLSFCCFEIILKEAVMIVTEQLWHEHSNILALEFLVSIAKEFFCFKVGINYVANISWCHSNSDDYCASIIAKELVLVHVVQLVHII